ncbi:formylglycine-generating enzyme family protein [Leptolyngbya sp. FACHB-1624]|nr:formylglycine-generating enzyme family protein [Leptolyngbya sp. FACHB-1624]
MEVFDRFALDLGDHYDVLAPVLVQMRRAFLRKQRDFHYALGEISEEMISRCVGFGHNLLNAELLAEFHYDRATKTIRGTMADQPDLAEFFMGEWFERYIYQKVANLLRERELRFSSLSHVTVTLPNRDRFELDLFFLVEDEPLLIECFTDRDIDRTIQRISQSAQRLEISDSRIFCIGLEMTLAQIAELHQQHRVTVGNRETFLAQIRTALVSEASLPTFSFEVITVNDRGEEIDRRPGQASYYREELAEGVFLDMVAIPGGTFWMGTAEGELGAREAEKPRHQVTIEPFFMGKFTVTQAQWRAIAQLPKVNRDLKLEPSHFKGDNRPVEHVSWEDAIEFCDRLNQKTGQLYRLPSEAEWEYACRAGTTTPFHFGETITPEIANYNGNYIYANAPKGIYRKQTIEVGSFPPNAFGLYDMHGNVWEWCADPWHDSYADAPTDGRVWESNKNVSRIPRGGSWNDFARDCRAAFRSGFLSVIFLNRRGFRLALSRPRTS